MNTVSLLFVGDIHLGRRPGHIPNDLLEYGINPSDLTPAAAWRRVVERAKQLQVDAVVLAGDVVDEDNAIFEAFGPLQSGVAELIRDGISVYAVAGNHDVEALPRLAAQIPEFRILGRGGKWEDVIIKDVVQVVGWSFPARVVRESPLARGIQPVILRSEIPKIGTLHCDLDSSQKIYAPVSHAELERAGLHMWVLGHIHKPSNLAERPIGYLGSLMGLDPTETKMHGPWLVKVCDGKIEIHQESIAPLRWEYIEVAVDSYHPGDEVLGLIRCAVEERHKEMITEGGTQRAVGCRIRLMGITQHARELRRSVDKEKLAMVCMTLDGTVYFIDEFACGFRQALDLDRIALNADPPGVLARQLLSLERGGLEAEELIREAMRELRKIADQPIYTQLENVTLGDEDVRSRLLNTGYIALEELLAQNNTGEGETE